MNIPDYADAMNLDLVIHRHHNQASRHTASFEHCETKESPDSAGLCSTYGNGATPAEAVQDYCNKIRGRILVVHAMSSKDRREYRVPMEIKP